MALKESSHRHSPLSLALAGEVRTLQQAPWTFAGLSRIFRETCSKIAQPTLLVCTIPNTGMRINNASISAAHLPVYKGAGSANMQVHRMPPRTQRGIFREKYSFFRELHRRSFAEGFEQRRTVTEYIIPCKDLLINPHAKMMARPSECRQVPRFWSGWAFKRHGAGFVRASKSCVTTFWALPNTANATHMWVAAQPDPKPCAERHPLGALTCALRWLRLLKVYIPPGT